MPDSTHSLAREFALSAGPGAGGKEHACTGRPPAAAQDFPSLAAYALPSSIRQLAT